MSVRQVLRTTLIAGAGLALTGSAAVLPLAGAAHADDDNATVSLIPIGSATEPSPFSSGQVIEVKVGANSTLAGQTSVNILECADPGGLAANLPGSIAQCDGNTIDSDTITPAADGSFDYSPNSPAGQSNGWSGYTVYALPDAHSLAEPPTQTPVCNLTNACVLYIGTNQGDFTKPKIFSAPFYVTPTANDTGANPGDGNPGPGNGTPEVPYAVALPVIAAGLAGGTLFFARRRRAATVA
jgi:hypothetical protein